MPDRFSEHAVGLTSPALSVDAIVPSDGTDLTRATRALYIGQPGNVRVRTVDGDIVVFANMQGGVIYPVRVDRVLATGTTASDILGLS